MGPGSWVHSQKLAEQQPHRLQAVFSTEPSSSGKLHAPLQVSACLVLMFSWVCHSIGMFCCGQSLCHHSLPVAIVSKGNPRKCQGSTLVLQCCSQKRCYDAMLDVLCCSRGQQRPCVQTFKDSSRPAVWSPAWTQWMVAGQVAANPAARTAASMVDCQSRG